MASGTPKTMSNRLMTMKFMQRSAAKSASSEPSTPNEPPNKRARLFNGTSSPGTPGNPSDRGVTHSVLTVEDRKREEALAKAGERSGETKWVLSFQDARDANRVQSMNVVQAGFAVLDADTDESEEETKPARMLFGGGVKKEKPASTVNTDTSEEPSSSEDDFDSDDPTAALIRETKREVATRERQAWKPRMQEVSQDIPRESTGVIDEDKDLSRLTSLSGGRPGGSGGGVQRNRGCYNCGETGHMKYECPKLKGKAVRGRRTR